MGVRRNAVRLVLAMVVGAGGALLPGVPAAPAGAAEPQVTFSSPGTSVWVVPEGVTAVTFDVYGATGATWSPFLRGGAGGRATVTVPVTAGATYTVGVGAAGWIGRVPIGAFGGGGLSLQGRGGGGASWVTDSAGQPVVVAGGGGGAGWYGSGGDGGGEEGARGAYDADLDPGPDGVDQPPLGEFGDAWSPDSQFPGSGGWAMDGSGGGGGGWQGGAAGTHGAGGSGGSGFGVAGTRFGPARGFGDGKVTITYLSGRAPVTVDPGSGRVTSAPAGIDCMAGAPSSCSTRFDIGTSITLTATPTDPGELFTGWSGACSGQGPTCALTVDQARSVRASFARPTLAVVSPGSGFGDVTSSVPGKDCVGGGPSTCTRDYDAGTTVTLTAQTQEGSIFQGWSGSGCTGTGTCTVTMTESRSVTATFWRPTLTVFQTGPGGASIYDMTPGRIGTYSCQQTWHQCPISFAVGAPVHLRPLYWEDRAEFVGWEGGGCSGTGECSFTMNGDVSVWATYRPVQRTLTVELAGDGASQGAVTSTPGGITCVLGSTDCQHGYDLGQQVTLSAAPSGAFTGWSGGGCSGTGTCVVTMSEAKNVVATFAPTFPLFVELDGGAVQSVPAGIDCRWPRFGSCSAHLAPGTQVELVATPRPGEEFVGWSGACTGPALSCSVTMDEERRVTASFEGRAGQEVDGYQLTVTTEGEGGGYVDAAGGIDCGTGHETCSAEYDPGAEVALTAHPAPGSEFTGWTSGCLGVAPTCTVTMARAWTVTASFGPVLQPVAVKVAGPGSGRVESTPGGIDCGAGGHRHCWWAYDYGSVLTLTATPDGDSVFAGWTGPCTGAGPTCTITTAGVQAVTARFAHPSRPLTVATVGGGSGRVECDGGPCRSSYDQGTTVTLRAVPDAASSVFGGWSGDCAGTSATCTLVLDRARSVTARFDLARRALSVVTVGAGSVSCAVDGVTGSCGTGFDHGTRLRLEATPAAGWALAGWSGDGCLGAGSDCQLTMDRDRLVTASFEPTPVPVTGMRALPGVWNQHTRNARLVVHLPEGIALPTNVSVVVSGRTTRSRTVPMSPGRNVLPFDGAWAEQTFRPGRYRVTVRAADAGGRWSAPAHLRWRVRR